MIESVTIIRTRLDFARNSTSFDVLVFSPTLSLSIRLSFEVVHHTSTSSHSVRVCQLTIKFHTVIKLESLEAGQGGDSKRDGLYVRGA